MPLPVEKIPYPHPLARKILRGKSSSPVKGLRKLVEGGEDGLSWGDGWKETTKMLKGRWCFLRGKTKTKINLSASCNLLELPLSMGWSASD